MPAQHRAVENRPPWQRACERRVEEPVLMPRPHALRVESVPQAVPERQRIEADPPVEPQIDAPVELARQADSVRLELPRRRHGRVAGPLSPGVRLLAHVEQKQLEAVAEPAAKLVHDARVEEETRRERVRENEPNRRHGAARVPTASAIRCASDAPSSWWKASASVGVPHAGQPSTPKTVTTRPGRSRRTVSPRPPTGA